MRWLVVFNDGFESAPRTTMVELYRFNLRCVEWNRVSYSCLLD